MAMNTEPAPRYWFVFAMPTTHIFAAFTDRRHRRDLVVVLWERCYVAILHTHIEHNRRESKSNKCTDSRIKWAVSMALINFALSAQCTLMYLYVSSSNSSSSRRYSNHTHTQHILFTNLWCCMKPAEKESVLSFTTSYYREITYLKVLYQIHII